MFTGRTTQALSRRVLPWLRNPRRTFILRSRQSGNGRPVEGLNLRRMADQRDDYHRSRRTFLAAGAVAGVVATVYTAWQLKIALDNPKRLDSAHPADPFKVPVDANRKVVIHDEDGRDLVPTGNSAVPEFPRTIDLPSYSYQAVTASESPSPDPNVPPSSPLGSLMQPLSVQSTATSTEYTLVGLGLRTVSFLGIQVYVVGYYIATSDIAPLQSHLVKRINSIATTLVPGEKDQLRRALLDPAEGEDIWEELLKERIPARSLFRVIPVRDTDFHHLRDGFVRAIQARSGKLALESSSGQAPGGPQPSSMQSRDLGESMREFRQIFNRGKVPKKKELLLLREEDGGLTVVYDEGKSQGRQFLGRVQDERISRALWLNYLAGTKVASEPARKSIVEGVMEFVERPVGTVASQVV